MKKSKSFQKKPEKLLGNEREGLLVAHFGAHAEIEDDKGHIFRCHLRKNLEPVITGDRVLWQPGEDNIGVIVDYLPRRSLLSRPENKKKLKPIAANIDAIIIVTAPNALSEHLIDRYLVAAENIKIPVKILLNKMDLLEESLQSEIIKKLKDYEKIGYQTFFSSTLTKHGLDLLDNFLREKSCVLVGASGVGKSSIISSFAPNEFVRVGETSAQGLGKHTTTMTRLYHLPHGGNLIDSPGVREFGLWHMDSNEIVQGFIEFKPFLNQCKFRDCQHLKEPGCAVKQAVEEGKISAKRYTSFKEMITENQDRLS